MRLRLERRPWAWFGFGILGFACQGSANIAVGSRAPVTPAASAPSEATSRPSRTPPLPPELDERDFAAERRSPRDRSRRSQRRNQNRERRLVLPGNLVFRTGSAQLAETPQNEEILAQLVSFLDEHPEVTLLRIEGHTDAIGDAEANLQLSGQRALAIKRALIARRIAPERLVAVGFGEREPLATNESHAGRALNRRTEFRIAEIQGNPTSNLGPLAGGTEFK